jgi:hypothetical protein
MKHLHPRRRSPVSRVRGEKGLRNRLLDGEARRPDTGLVYRFKGGVVSVVGQP